MSVENPTGDWLIFAESAEPRRAGVPVPFSEVGFSTEPFPERKSAWTAVREFGKVSAYFPELRESTNACRPGKTFAIPRHLANDFGRVFGAGRLQDGETAKRR
jgi:hypothetical protein